MHNTEPQQYNGVIRQHILVITLLGAIAVETQGLIGQELIGQGVTGSSKGDTGVSVSGVKREEWRVGGGSRSSLCMWDQDRETYARTTPIEKRIVRPISISQNTKAL